ncbi:hypothetical protein [Haloarcula laminariae]|uniref:hypothetical protein n=1 Tax=Haloarcula laminariae TaxID=2961577 RepID=UPI0021C583DE|nr:hypothetical protein [Halomicroarcula laminariae]
MTFTRSKTARIADVLERYLKKSVFIGVQGMVASGTVAMGYLVIGGLLTVVNSPLAPQSFLSMENDPYFFCSIAVVSIFIIQATGSLILYKFLTGVEDQRSQFVILVSYIGLGFGGAALRFTLPQSLDFVLTLL